MKNYLIIFACVLSFNTYSQSKDTIYFLINKKDSLIEKQLATRQNRYEGYLILDEKKVKKLNRTPLVKGKVWIPESDDDFYQFGPSFTFDRNKDTVVSKSYINSLEVIRDRRKFLEIIKNLNESTMDFYFIELVCNGNKYIIREVNPIIFE